MEERGKRTEQEERQGAALRETGSMVERRERERKKRKMAGYERREIEKRAGD